VPDQVPVDDAAWNAYLLGVKDQMVGSWNRLRDAYLTHQRIRAQLGLQQVMQPGEKFDRGALTEETEQDILHLQATVILLSDFMDQAISGNRKLWFDKGQSDFLIEQSPNDTITVQRDARGAMRLVEISTGKEVPVDGAVGNPFAIVAGIAVVAIGVYFTTATICDTVRTSAEEATKQTITTNQTKQLELGATPEQVKANTDAIYEGAAQLERAKGESKQKEGESGLQKTIRTVAYVGLGIAVVALLIKVAPVALPAARV
jgi:hypothetical protein